MNPKDFARVFDGSQYPFHPSSESWLKENRCVVIYGASDDTLRCEGLIKDDASVYMGGVVYLSPNGFLGVSESGNLSDSIETIEEARRIVQEFDSSIKIEAIWDSGEYSWQYKIHNPEELECAEFDILEGNEKYCRAIVLRFISQ